MVASDLAEPGKGRGDISTSSLLCGSEFIKTASAVRLFMHAALLYTLLGRARGIYDHYSLEVY